MKYSEFISIIKNRNWKYPQKIKLDPLPFNPFSSEARGCINAQVKAPIAFSPENGFRTQIYLIDESGSPEKNGDNPIFQIGLLQGEKIRIDSLNQEIGELRKKWPARNRTDTKFHHSKDLIQRRQLFEDFCLRQTNISFLHYKIDKEKNGIIHFNQEHKATIYFSALLSAIHDSQYSHGKIEIIASDRPKTFSDILVYELQRRSRMQALIDMIKHPIVGCCLPTIKLVRERAEDYPSLDLCDYLISIIGKGDFSFQWKYGGCSLFEIADKFENWNVHETYYSNNLVFPEGRLLIIIRRKIPLVEISGSIVSRINHEKTIPEPIKKCAYDIENSKTKDDFLGAIFDLSSRIGPHLDSKYAKLPVTSEEYLNIKSVGAKIKLLLDYGTIIGNEDPFSGKEQFFRLKWR